MESLIAIILVLLFISTFFFISLKEKVFKIYRPKNIFRFLIIIGLLITIIFASIVDISPGYVGVASFFGIVQKKVLKDDNNFVIPFSQIDTFNISTKRYSYSVYSYYSKDYKDNEITHDDYIFGNLDYILVELRDSPYSGISFNINIFYNIKESEAFILFNEYGTSYFEIFFKPTARKVIYDISLKYLKRDYPLNDEEQKEFKNELLNNLKNAFNGKGIWIERLEVSKVYIVHTLIN